MRIKRISDGNVQKFKARVITRGKTQRPSADFNNAYAPVGDFIVVLLVLNISLPRDCDALYVDVKAAFLNGDIDR